METAVQTSQRVTTVFNIMRLTYGIVPIVAGLDKFTNILANWEKYLNPAIAEILPFTPHTFMIVVGIIEIVAGLIVLSKPTVGGYLVMVWLALIGLTLLATKDYLDIAVRDFVMAIGAYSLAQIGRSVLESKEQHAAHRKMAFT